MKSKLLPLATALLVCFGACTVERSKSAALGLTLEPGQSALIACAPTGGAAGAPTVLGGMRSTGGRSSATGGTRASTGGTACTTPETPTANSAVLSNARQAMRHALSPRHKRAINRAEATPAAAANACYPWQTCPATPLNQENYGACTGNSGIEMISCAPFNSLDFYSETYALEAYQGGTCIDNKCSIPCTATTCSKAFNPATGANDTGSSGTSVASWLQQMGLLKGYTTADTTSTLLAGLTRTNCIIGVDFYNSMFTPAADGRLKIVASSGLAGGHEMVAVRYDPALDGVWVRTSWGPVWWCLDSQVTANTPIDGTGCGYAWIAVADLPTLHFDGDCPVP